MATPIFIQPLLRRLAAICSLGLLFACGEGDDAITAESLPVLAQGQMRTDARNGNVCPLATPFFLGGKCRAGCKEGYKQDKNGVCLTKECKEGYLYRNSKCYEKRDMLVTPYESDTLACYANENRDKKRACSCRLGGERWKNHWGPGTNTRESLRIYTGAFCSSPTETLPKNYRPPSGPIRTNCRTGELNRCGIGAYSHCTVRTNPTTKKDLCVWKLPDFGYPICEINPNNANEALCDRTE